MSNAIATKETLEVIEPTKAMPVTPYDMVTQAVMNGASVDVVGKLLDLHERWEANRARKAFDAAMSDAKAEIGPIQKNRQVKFESKNGGAKTDYRHEDLAEVARTVDPILAKFGLSYRYQTEQVEGQIRVTCIVSHREGHSERNTLFAGGDSSGNKNGIQAIGSTITYLQRYTLKAALGLAASNDDDGKTAGKSDDDLATISAEQVEQLQTKIIEVGADPERFMRFAGVERLQDFLAKDFAPAMAKLDAKAKKDAANG